MAIQGLKVVNIGVKIAKTDKLTNELERKRPVQFARA